MALGGGNFVAQNKKLPGTYINFISASKASSAISDRGIAAIAVELDWGADNEIIEISSSDFNKNTLKILGYDYASDKLKGLRDLFLNIRKLYLYRLNSGEKAKVTIEAGDGKTGITVTAKYSGTRGNNIRIVVQKNLDDDTKYDVSTYLDTKQVDKQTVSATADLVDNDFVIFSKTGELAVTAGSNLTGGSNGTVTGESHQNFLDKLEAYSFNALGCISKESSITSLYTTFTKRLRDEMGIKFQTVVYNNAADHEGVVNVKNRATEDDTALIYWVTGVIAGCAINKSNTNKVYDGEYTVEAECTQTELENAIDSGFFVFHKVGNDIRVLKDINSLVTTDVDKGADFKNNQTIRVLDQLAIDVATIFNTNYIGNIPNNESGRLSLWNDIVTIYNQYLQMQAIENFASEDITVEQGNDKESVTVNGSIQPVNAMEKLYMTIVVE